MIGGGKTFIAVKGLSQTDGIK